MDKSAEACNTVAVGGVAAQQYIRRARAVATLTVEALRQRLSAAASQRSIVTTFLSLVLYRRHSCICPRCMTGDQGRSRCGSSPGPGSEQTTHLSVRCDAMHRNPAMLPLLHRIAYFGYFVTGYSVRTSSFPRVNRLELS
jgi:hypothetical protein